MPEWPEFHQAFQSLYVDVLEDLWESLMEKNLHLGSMPITVKLKIAPNQCTTPVL
jgi:hypothetical protein